MSPYAQNASSGFALRIYLYAFFKKRILPSEHPTRRASDSLRSREGEETHKRLSLMNTTTYIVYFHVLRK
jgi:hypothetical protein